MTVRQRDGDHDGNGQRHEERREKEPARTLMEKRPTRKRQKGRRKAFLKIRDDVPAHKLPLEPLDRACPDYQFDLPEALFQICSVSIPPPPV